MSNSKRPNVIPSAAPLIGQHAHEIQAHNSMVAVPLALAESTRRMGVTNLNQLLADTITLRDLYKKHHWQLSGPIPGTKRVKYLDDNPGTVNVRLTADDLTQIDAILPAGAASGARYNAQMMLAVGRSAGPSAQGTDRRDNNQS